MSQNYKDYSNIHFDPFILIEKVEATIQLISALIIFQNNTHIYNQSSIVNSFLSTVTFENSKMSNISLSEIGIEIVSSTLIMENLEITQVNNPLETDFIVALLESDLTLRDITYSDSNSILFRIRTCSIEVSNLDYDNIIGATQLFEIFDGYNTTINDVTSKNSEASLGRLFAVINSENITFTNIYVNKSLSTPIVIENSHLELMDNITIQNSYMGMEIKTSTIDLITSSEFTKNGASTLYEGGGLHISDSFVKIEKTSFTENRARTGAAIYTN